MPDLHTLPHGWRPENAIRNNGPTNVAIERFKLRELAEGWPMYRDSCEWENLESIFAPPAYMYTSWTGKTPYRDFIAASKAGMDKGAFIMHRCLGCTTDINREGTRAVTKMKAIITQRFWLEGCEVDADSDCRFCFFFEKGGDEWYEKDKLVPVSPNEVPKLDEVELEKHPYGYRHLSYCQEATMGISVFKDLPAHRREGDSTVNGKAHDLLYVQVQDVGRRRQYRFLRYPSYLPVVSGNADAPHPHDDDALMWERFSRHGVLA